jgi:hypothetical protein
MCPLLAQLKIGFFSSFTDAAVYSTNKANKAGLKQSIIFRCLWLQLRSSWKTFVVEKIPITDLIKQLYPLYPYCKNIKFGILGILKIFY